ncbi:MAG: AAA family ATPase [Pirellula sp.]
MNGVPLQNNSPSDLALEHVRQLNENVIVPLKQSFVGKDEIIDLLAVALVARENLFLLGPPGTAKSALVRSIASRIDGRFFDYLLTKFTEPNELFGPFDIRKLREGDLVTNTEGMLPEADFVFLDELLNANSSILNSLLMALNERVFRRGRETRPLPALMFVGASNRLPEEESLNALFDRFLLRVRCDNVVDSQLPSVLQAGWAMQEVTDKPVGSVSIEGLRQIQSLVASVDLAPVMSSYISAITRMRRAGIAVSDRRAVKLQRPIAASALLCSRSTANVTDLWILRHCWDVEEQREVLASIVESSMQQATPDDKAVSHPQSQGNEPPNAEEIAAALDRILKLVNRESLPADSQGTDNTIAPPSIALRDQLAELTTRSQWISNETQRSYLQAKCQTLWDLLKQLEGK